MDEDTIRSELKTMEEIRKDVASQLDQSRSMIEHYKKDAEREQRQLETLDRGIAELKARLQPKKAVLCVYCAQEINGVLQASRCAVGPNGEHATNHNGSMI